MRFLTDEDFNNRIFRGIRRRLSRALIIRAQDEGLRGVPDKEILEWAANVGYVVISHDVNTMIMEAYERIKQGKLMAGLIIVPQSIPLKHAIDDLHVLIIIGDPQDFENQVIYLPL